MHKSFVVVAVEAQAVQAYILHTVGPALVDNWNTEVLEHFVKDLKYFESKI